VRPELARRGAPPPPRAPSPAMAPRHGVRCAANLPAACSRRPVRLACPPAARSQQRPVAWLVAMARQPAWQLVACPAAACVASLPDAASRGQPARRLPDATARGQPARRAQPSSQPDAEPSPVRLPHVPRRPVPGSLARRGVLPVGPGRHPAVVVDRKDTLAELLPSC
jgi:hypothetical protein